jgi:hypothetical protein
MSHGRTSLKPAPRVVRPGQSQGGKLELRLPRIPGDVRTYFAVSLLAYTCYDFVFHPLFLVSGLFLALARGRLHGY